MQQQNQTHYFAEPVSTNSNPTNSLHLCVLHNQQINNYCESCEDVICQSCALKQPHSGVLHRVETLENAFNRRVEFMRKLISQNMNQKRKSLMDHIDQLNTRIQEIQYTGGIIMRDITLEKEGITRRLRQEESEKILKIQTEIKRLSSQVNLIDDVYYAFEESIKVPEKFMLLYKEFKDKLNMIKIFKIQAQIPNELDLVDEVKVLHENMQKVKTLEKKTQFINEVLYSFTHTYKDDMANRRNELQRAAQQKIVSCVSMNEDLLKSQVSVYSRICHFCGLAFTIANVNNSCSMNNKALKIQKQFSSQPVDLRFKGTKRHHWVALNPAYCRKPTQSNNTINNKQLYHLGLKQLKRVLLTIKKQQEILKIDLDQVFKKDDEHKNGKVSRLVFLYKMTKSLKIPEADCQLLMEYLSTEKGIEYTKVETLMHEPEYYQNQHKSEEQQWDKKKSFAPKSKYYPVSYC